jgi:hypothetical protein
MKKIALAVLLFAAPAAAADYAPPSQETWNQMVAALQGVSMPLAAHQQISSIIATVQQAAQAEAAREKADAAKNK